MATISQSAAPPRALRPLVTLLAGNGGVAAITLVRNVVVARLIGVEEFGIAASLAILLSAVEMATNLGVQQTIVRDKRAAQGPFQPAMHTVQVLRGLVGAVLIYALAQPAAEFMAVPDATWAFEVAALIPLIAGMAHLDPWRVQAASRFGPSILVQLGPALLTLMLVPPLYTKFGDFRVLLVASVVQATGIVVMSHLVAESRYQIGWHRRFIPQAIRFGLPLAFNGVLLLAVFHGEKALVAHVYGPSELAILAMGFTLTLTPALVIGKSLQSYSLPLLSRSGSAKAFRTEAQQVMWLCGLTGVGLALSLLALNAVVPSLLGPEFAPLATLFPILAVLHGLRVAKTGMSITALAKGDTFNTAIGNAPRILALPLVYLALMEGAGLFLVLLIATVAEAVGLATAYAGVRRMLRKL